MTAGGSPCPNYSLGKFESKPLLDNSLFKMLNIANLML